MNGSTPRTQLPSHLRADCSACVGICCVALPFDALQGFGFDKPARTPCAHLCANFTCGIHGALAERGFTGCTVYDCQGAGQRVTQRLAPGPGWMHDDATARPVYEAYEVLRPLHELLALLATAQAHVSDARLRDQQAEIEALCERAPLAQIDVGRLRRQTLELLRQPEIAQALRATLLRA